MRTTLDAPLGEVEDGMRKTQIRRMPVVDSAGELAGIVTVGDIAQSAQSSDILGAVRGLRIVSAMSQLLTLASS